MDKELVCFDFAEMESCISPHYAEEDYDELRRAEHPAYIREEDLCHFMNSAPGVGSLYGVYLNSVTESDSYALRAQYEELIRAATRREEKRQAMQDYICNAAIHALPKKVKMFPKKIEEYCIVDVTELQEYQHAIYCAMIDHSDVFDMKQIRKQRKLVRSLKPMEYYVEIAKQKRAARKEGEKRRREMEEARRRAMLHKKIVSLCVSIAMPQIELLYKEKIALHYQKYNKIIMDAIPELYIDSENEVHESESMIGYMLTGGFDRSELDNYKMILDRLDNGWFIYTKMTHVDDAMDLNDGKGKRDVYVWKNEPMVKGFGRYYYSGNGAPLSDTLSFLEIISRYNKDIVCGVYDPKDNTFYRYDTVTGKRAYQFTKRMYESRTSGSCIMLTIPKGGNVSVPKKLQNLMQIKIPKPTGYSTFVDDKKTKLLNDLSAESSLYKRIRALYNKLDSDNPEEQMQSNEIVNLINKIVQKL